MKPGAVLLYATISAALWNLTIIALGGMLAWWVIGPFVVGQGWAPEASGESLFDYLAEAEVNLIGTIPPPSGLEAQWIATISADLSSALRTAWPDLIADQGGGGIVAPLSVTNINPELFSPGRQRLVEAINLVRGDFAKILVITHIDDMKDRFPNRIEVEKTERGSMVSLV